MKYTHSFNLANWGQLNALHKFAFTHLKLKEHKDFHTESTSSKNVFYIKESEETQELIKSLEIKDTSQLFLFSYTYKRSHYHLEDYALYRVLKGIDYSPSTAYYQSLAEASINSINHREALKELEFQGCNCEDSACDCEDSACDCESSSCEFLSLKGLILTFGPCYEKAAREIEHALHLYPLLNDDDYMRCIQCDEGFDIEESDHNSYCFCSGWCEDQHKEDHITQCELCECEALKAEGANADFFYDLERYMNQHYCSECDQLLKALYYVGDSKEAITGEELLDLNDGLEIERLAEAQEKGASHAFNTESIYSASYVRQDQNKLL